MVVNHGKRVLNSMKTRIRARRKEMGLTIIELAKRSGIHRNTLTLYEKGELPKLTVLFDLAKALHCSIHWLITGIEKGKPPGEEVLNHEMLATVIQDVEDIANKKGLSLTVKQRAEAIAVVYGQSIENGRKLDRRRITKIISIESIPA